MAVKFRQFVGIVDDSFYQFEYPLVVRINFFNLI